VIDIHTHLLPKIDDGSGSTQETLELLGIMKNQGVDHVYMTPHFYADDEDPEHFLRRRERAFEAIKDNIAEYKVSLGAEVRYFSGIGRTDQLKDLMLEGTKCLLLELPDRGASRYLIDDLMNIRGRDIHPILAHLNRYPEFVEDRFIDFCMSQDIYIQLNTESVMDRRTRKRAIELMSEGRAQFIATDCHDAKHRRPDLAEAVDVLKRYMTEEKLQRFFDREERILNES